MAEDQREDTVKKLKHPWWHWFFTSSQKTPQLVPPSWVGNRMIIDSNTQYYCRICHKGWEVSCLDKYRKREDVEP